MKELEGFIWIGDPWPSKNVWYSYSRDHAVLRARQKKKIEVWHHDAHWQLTACGIRAPQPLDFYRATVHLRRVGPNELDRDGLWGGVPGLVDAMKAKPLEIRDAYTKKIIRRMMRADGYPEREWGLYADDREKFLDLKVDQIVDRGGDSEGTYVKVAWAEIPEAERPKPVKNSG